MARKLEIVREQRSTPKSSSTCSFYIPTGITNSAIDLTSVNPGFRNRKMEHGFITSSDSNHSIENNRCNIVTILAGI